MLLVTVRRCGVKVYAVQEIADALQYASVRCGDQNLLVVAHIRSAQFEVVHTLFCLVCIGLEGR